jgi:hypothetical protein
MFVQLVDLCNASTGTIQYATCTVYGHLYSNIILLVETITVEMRIYTVQLRCIAVVRMYTNLLEKLNQNMYVTRDEL